MGVTPPCSVIYCPSFINLLFVFICILLLEVSYDAYSAAEQESNFFIFLYFYIVCLASTPISKNTTKLMLLILKNVLFPEIQTFPIVAILKRSDP